MKDPSDYYKTHNIRPNVIQYDCLVQPIHNGIPIETIPVLFEDGDDYELKYDI